MPKARNPFACAPIMRKGGAHIKSKSGQRRSQKHKLRDVVDDYLDEKQQTSQNRFIDKTDESVNYKFCSIVF